MIIFQHIRLDTQTASDGGAPMTSVKEQIAEDTKADESSTSVAEAAAMVIVQTLRLLTGTPRRVVGFLAMRWTILSISPGGCFGQKKRRPGPAPRADYSLTFIH